MRVLVIGGTGIISTSIVAHLLQRGDEVTCYNRGQTESRLPPGARQIAGDRKDYAAFEHSMAGELWDAVIDMVAFVPDDIESAIRAFRGRIGQYLFCSTVCVYGGELSRLPAREDEPRTPTGTYGRNKAACEDLLFDANADNGFPFTILRPSHTYSDPGWIVHSLGRSTTFIDRLRKGRPVVLHGDGSSLWVACHADDVARGFVGALGNPAAIGQAYNLTGDQWLTWNDYTRTVAEAAGGPPAQIVHIPTDALDSLAPERTRSAVEIFQYNSVFDNKAARRDLVFEYTIPWAVGARRTIEWLYAHGKVQSSESDPFDDRVVAAWHLAVDRWTSKL